MIGMEKAWLLPAIMGATFAFLLLFGRYLPRRGDWLAIAAGFTTFALFFPILADLRDTPTELLPGGRSWDWIRFPGFQVALGFEVDQITIVMLAVVTFVGSVILLYSTGYMRGDPRYGWFFTAMTFFIAAMLTLVLADNLLLLYIAWEGVGFGSYLLIGFWHERRSAAEAAKKAFVTTRIGDVGLLIGIILLWREAGTFDISEIIEAAEAGKGLLGDGTYLTLAVLLIFAGAVGKSAQFPLHVWLPDAMEGPTPVSALIHAATMVAAGVYLVARLFPI
ncbi:MAG: NADH-quinone oxidoreductase subunit L, partial [Dehalococcoidia bacterium]